MPRVRKRKLSRHAHMRGDYRQYCHLYFDVDYSISLLCSSFRYGLSCLYESENRQFGQIDELQFGQIQFVKI